jgi:uncharacterized protein (TIGR00251 family)
MDLFVRVTPNAAANKITDDIKDDGTRLLRVYVTVPPEDGKANAAVVKLLATYLNLPKSSLTIVRGETGRDKVVRVEKS